MNQSVLTHFSFSELWGPLVFFITVLLSVIYLLYVGPLRNRFYESEPVKTRQKILSISGLFTFYIAVGSPINAFNHHVLFSAHMLKQALLYFIMPLFFYLGTPSWLIRPLLNTKFSSKFLSFFNQPILAMFLFNSALSLYHFPVVFSKLMEVPFLGGLYHVLLVIASFQMWWPLMCPVPELDKLSNVKKLGYIAANAILLYPACVAIIFAGNILYDLYVNAPQLFSFLSPIDDQQLGGIIMKMTQETAFVVTLAIISVRWYRKEKHDDPIEVYDSPNQRNNY
ncbi:cytochrome c oxidase assembly protein [Paenibacillus sp. p3-SID867]|uniref:cytochrome c oxidase assembly protein n=1 Tax=Paenibacillus sp. p3-SID867 TaxID=2916363 RepID=UPI0021A3F84A|nr:cytochrome c oxidase assembly protein [Paenibacillus sp. p3-SID867]MCT1403046.1 cytochrome c oxidase assembly protein [Paenibacillus sp. p3-SID867]